MALPDDDWIEGIVDVETSEANAAIRLRLLTETIPSINSQFIKAGAFHGSARVNRCANKVADAVIEMIRCRLDAEREAHVRAGAHEVSDQRMERVRAAVEHLTGDGLDELLRAASSGGERDFMANYAPALKEIRERVEETGRLGLKRLLLDVQKPPTVARAGGDTFIQNVNAPNYGVLAQRIGRVDV